MLQHPWGPMSLRRGPIEVINAQNKLVKPRRTGRDDPPDQTTTDGFHEDSHLDYAASYDQAVAIDIAIMMTRRAPMVPLSAHIVGISDHGVSHRRVNGAAQ